MPKPVCVRCRRFYKIKQNGKYFTEAMPIRKGAAPGLAEPESWQPYKVWAADLWECLGCGSQILSGFGAAPVLEQHHANFTREQRRFGAEQLQINDC